MKLMLKLSGFYNEMTVCFKPLAGIFSQFKYLPLKYMGNLTIELELVNSAVDCIIDPNNFDESDTGITTDLRNRFTVAVAGDVGKGNKYINRLGNIQRSHCL